ncbi:MAG TPA: hypothetical protein VHC69_15965 [Polyangiaceae bacterium]|nr:hypothetical protein [Polyangiaceae bacterium]
MASKQHATKYDPNGLPLRGPGWSLSAYFFALLALLTFLAIIIGFIHAGALTG